MREPCMHCEHHPWGGYFCALASDGLRVECDFVNHEEDCELYEPSGEDVERGLEKETMILAPVKVKIGGEELKKIEDLVVNENDIPETVIDKFNSIGCTSFVMNIKDIPHKLQGTRAACSVMYDHISDIPEEVLNEVLKPYER